MDGAVALVMRIENTWKRLLELAARDASHEERFAATMALRAELRAAGQSQAADAIVHFLESGRDVATGLLFGPGPDGFLETAPSLRTLLLDELERADRALARDLAETVFAASSVADEWALALRITAHAEAPGDAGARVVFRQRIEALLHNPAWRAAPTAGFLHAFDAAVHSRDPVVVEDLAQLVAGTNSPAVTFAARLALERMVIQDYATTAGRLAADPTLAAADAEFRGLLFARADVSDSAQRAVLDRFLTDPATPPAELQSWAKYFPHRAKHISNNLLTRDGPTPVAELARMDRAALAVVRDWRASSAMARRAELLAPVQERLERYVSQAEKNHPAPTGTP